MLPFCSGDAVPQRHRSIAVEILAPWPYVVFSEGTLKNQTVLAVSNARLASLVGIFKDESSVRVLPPPPTHSPLYGSGRGRIGFASS